MKVEPRLPPSQFLPHLNTNSEGITFNMNLERTSHIQTVVIVDLFHLAIYATPLELAILKLDRKVHSRNPDATSIPFSGSDLLWATPSLLFKHSSWYFCLTRRASQNSLFSFRLHILPLLCSLESALYHLSCSLTNDFNSFPLLNPAFHLADLQPKAIDLPCSLLQSYNVLLENRSHQLRVATNLWLLKFPNNQNR